MLAFDRSMSGNVIQGLNVIANASPNMTLYVQTGVGFIPTGTSPSNYNYRIAVDTSGGEAVTVSTAAASPRIDYIVAYVDKSVTGSTSGSFVNNTNNVLKFAAVAGTPAGSPVVPTVGQIQTAIGASNPYVILAQVAVAAGVSTITNSAITDLRVYAAPSNSRALGSRTYVDTGCLWSATSGLNGQMSAGLTYINVGGVMVPVALAAISSQAFTASQDTYVYLNVLGTVGYLPVNNNAASPTLPANSVWLAIVVTSASAITSVNYGQITATTVAPVFNTFVVMVSDTNGQLIYPRAGQRLIAYRRSLATLTAASTSPVALSTNFGVTALMPASATSLKITVDGSTQYTTAANSTVYRSIWNGAVGTGTKLSEGNIYGTAGSQRFPVTWSADDSPTAGAVVTYNVGASATSGTATFEAAAGYPLTIKVETA